MDEPAPNSSCTLPDDTRYTSLLLQAVLPLPSFNPHVLKIGREGSEMLEPTADEATLALVTVNAWSAAMALAIKERQKALKLDVESSEDEGESPGLNKASVRAELKFAQQHTQAEEAAQLRAQKEAAQRHEECVRPAAVVYSAVRPA